MNRCAIIVPVHNRAALTRQCLRLLLPRVADGLCHEVVVVDDGSTDTTRLALASFGSQIRAISLPEHGGLAAACNAGAAATEAELLVFLSRDVIPRHGWLERLVTCADQHHRVGAVGSKLVPVGELTLDALERIDDQHDARAGQQPVFRSVTPDSGRAESISSHCMLVPRTAFLEVGGYDSSVADRLLDADLCRRLIEHGYAVGYCDESRVLHLDALCQLAPAEGRGRGANPPPDGKGSHSGVSGDDVRKTAPIGDATPPFSQTAGEPARLGLSPTEFLRNREMLAATYLHGRGIEIGALHQPLAVPPTATVQYVDRKPVEQLRTDYTTIDPEALVTVDIVADGERLETIGDGTQDFVIANHFLEHCQNPILALLNMVRVLRIGGTLYLAVPDKRVTFDVDRDVTPFEHLLRDYQEGPEWSRKAHFEEWVRLVDKNSEEDVPRRVDALMQLDYSIHYHVWTQWELVELLAAVRSRYALNVDFELVHRNIIEIVVILRKLG